MAVSEARKNANRKWDQENMKAITVHMRKEQQEAFKAACASEGTTASAVLLQFIRQYIAEHAADPQPEQNPGQITIDDLA